MYVLGMSVCVSVCLYACMLVMWFVMDSSTSGTDTCEQPRMQTQNHHKEYTQQLAIYHAVPKHSTMHYIIDT